MDTTHNLRYLCQYCIVSSTCDVCKKWLPLNKISRLGLSGSKMTNLPGCWVMLNCLP